MPLLHTMATVPEEQSLGHLQELTSPVLGKLKEALIYTRLANTQSKAFGSRTVVLTSSGNAVAQTPQCRRVLAGLKATACGLVQEF